MRIEDIVNNFNTHIKERRSSFGIETNGHLVLQKSIKPCSTFKAYKECEYILWFVKSKSKYRFITIKKVIKLLESQGDTVLKDIDSELSKALFDIIGSTSYDKIITGEYTDNEGCE